METPIDGSTVREHLLAAERATGVTPQALLDVPECPEDCEILWQVFRELHSCRGNNGFGPTRITYMDLDAFQRVSRLELHPWELEAIRRADQRFLQQMARSDASSPEI